MKIFNKFKIIKPYPALYLDELKAVIITDLHLGLEGIMAEEGFTVPKFQLRELKKDIEEVLDREEVEKLIILGDLKQKFGETSFPEWDEINEFLDLVEEKVEEVIITKGNHDNYLKRATSKRDKTELVERYEIEDILFAHGHDLSLEAFTKDYIVIGHEHPAIELKGEIASEKIKCFLYGQLKEKKILVVPAFSQIACGSKVNGVPYYELLTPILQDPEVENFRAIGVGREIGLLEFPRIKDI